LSAASRTLDNVAGRRERVIPSCFPGAYRVDWCDPAPLFDGGFRHAATIGRRTIDWDEASSVPLPARFDGEMDSWLGLAQALLAREGVTRVRVSMLATDAGVDEHALVRSALPGYADACSDGAVQTLERHQASRVALDALYDFRGPLFSGEIAVLLAVERLVDHLLDPEPIDERAHQHQARVRDRALIVESKREPRQPTHITPAATPLSRHHRVTS
jgi:hypothetical protein